MRLLFESKIVKDKILHNLSELERNLNKDLYVDFDLEIDTAWLNTPDESNKILRKLKGVIDLLSEENTDATWLKYDLDLAKEIYRQILTLHGSSNKLFLETVGQDGTSYEEIASKSVTDFDGFYTDYTMYYDILNDKYVNESLTESFDDSSVYALTDDHDDILKVFLYKDDAEYEKKDHHKIEKIVVPSKFIEWLQNKLVLEDA